MKNKPPLIISSAKVLKYALVDSSVEFTDRLCLYVDGKRLGKVPKLAICQNYKEKDYLLFFCDKNWKVLGADGNVSIRELKKDAEKAYKGITKKWVTVAKPNIFKNWPGDLRPFCSFCGKSIFEVHGRIIGEKDSYICYFCVEKYSNMFKEIEERLNTPIETDRE